MKERIEIKNFGPIKKASIDIRKITILIGEVGTGKSIISKLIYAFREGHNSDKGIATRSIALTFQDSGLKVYMNEGTEVNYFYNEFHYVIRRTNDANVSVDNKTSDNLTKKVYDDLKGNIKAEEKNKWNLFIPAERIFYSEYTKALPTLLQYKSPTSMWVTLFANEFIRAKMPLKEVEIKFLNVSIDYRKGDPQIIVSKDKKIPLLYGASGIQATAPVCTILDFNKKRGANRSLNLIIEEPELNLHPKAQKDFVEYIIGELEQDKEKNKNTLLINTHSPYVISTIDNLIQANNTFQENKKLKSDINKIVPQHLWLDIEDVSVYELSSSGLAKNLIDEKNKTIKGSKIDTVSENIENSFHKLLDLI